MRNGFKLCAVAAMLAGMAGTAAASTSFLFNPNGTGAGGAVTATTMDQAPGNALAVGGVSAAAACVAAAGGYIGAGIYNCAGANIYTQFVYQANLSQFTNLGTPVFNQNAGSRNFTFTASVTEQVTTVAVLAVAGAGTSNPGAPTLVNANFVLAPAAAQTNNFFRMYFTGATGGNDLTGANFAPVAAGNPILQGVATLSTSTSTSNSGCVYTLGGQTCGNLDNFIGDNWNSFDTVANNGSTQLTFSVTAANAGYFPDLPIGSLITLDVNTSQVLPFNEANPSCAMISAAGVQQGYALGAIDANGNCVSNGRLGSINGAPQLIPGAVFDFLFQADANSSLDFQRVPEPGSLALLASSLMAAGFLGRRRKTVR